MTSLIVRNLLCLAVVGVGFVETSYSSTQKGDHVCVVQNTSVYSLYYSIERAVSLLSAQKKAIDNCLKGASFESHCMQPTCEQDLQNAPGIKTKLVIKNTQSKVTAEYEGATVGAEATVQNKYAKEKKIYQAKAPTLLEAQALALNLCTYEATFKNHCEVTSRSE